MQAILILATVWWAYLDQISEQGDAFKNTYFTFWQRAVRVGFSCSRSSPDAINGTAKTMARWFAQDSKIENFEI